MILPSSSSSNQDNASAVIAPGIGLMQSPKVSGQRRANEVVLFEHSEHGTGGLVLNCPTPLRLKDIPVARYAFFSHLPLMMGCGLENDGSSSDTNKSEGDLFSWNEGESKIPLSDLAPWFWLHNLPDIPGSTVLEAAAGPLYMGGNLDQATVYLQENEIDPAGRIKFFREYKSWAPGDLMDEIELGIWSFGPQEPEKALRYL